MHFQQLEVRRFNCGHARTGKNVMVNRWRQTWRTGEHFNEIERCRTCHNEASRCYRASKK